MGKIKRNTMTKFHTYQKKRNSGVLRTKSHSLDEDYFEKKVVVLLFICVIVNTVSVSMLFKDTSYEIQTTKIKMLFDPPPTINSLGFFLGGVFCFFYLLFLLIRNIR